MCHDCYWLSSMVQVNVPLQVNSHLGRQFWMLCAKWCWKQLRVGRRVLCLEFSPSLRPRAHSCERIMTWTDLFKALTQWQYERKKQLILCWRQFGLRPRVCFRIQNSWEDFKRGWNHVEMLTSTASCRAKHIQTHIRPCAQHACVFVVYDHLEPAFALNLRFNGCEAVCRCIARTESLKTDDTKLMRKPEWYFKLCSISVLCFCI